MSELTAKGFQDFINFYARMHRGEKQKFLKNPDKKHQRLATYFSNVPQEFKDFLDAYWRIIEWDILTQRITEETISRTIKSNENEARQKYERAKQDVDICSDFIDTHSDIFKRVNYQGKDLGEPRDSPEQIYCNMDRIWDNMTRARIMLRHYDLEGVIQRIKSSKKRR